MGKRRESTQNTRRLAGESAKLRPHPKHISNDDEQKFRATVRYKFGNDSDNTSHLMSSTKGRAHNDKT